MLNRESWHSWHALTLSGWVVVWWGPRTFCLADLGGYRVIEVCRVEHSRYKYQLVQLQPCQAEVLNCVLYSYSYSLLAAD